MKENPMRKITIEKVTLNIGIGESGEKLEKAKKLLENFTGKKVVLTKAKKRNTFGSSKGKKIGAKVTLRDEKAIEILKKVLEAKEMKLKERCFDKNGNFSFGIHEHIDIPGVKYDPKIGIYGMDICVTLQRPGFSIKRKKINKKIGKTHKIKKEDAMDFANKKLGIDVIK